MDEIDLMLVKGYVWEISKSMEIEIERIKKHRPEATNYIQGMTRHIGRMDQVLRFLCWSDVTNRELMRKAYDKSLEVEKLKERIKQLEAENKRLFDGI